MKKILVIISLLLLRVSFAANHPDKIITNNLTALFKTLNESQVTHLEDQFKNIEALSEKISSEKFAAVTEAETIKYILENPPSKLITPYLFTLKTFEEESALLDKKTPLLNPIAAALVKRIKRDLFMIAHHPRFPTYLKNKRMIMFSKDKKLRLIDKKIKYLSNWWSFLINEEAPYINKNLQDMVVQIINKLSDVSLVLLTPPALNKPAQKDILEELKNRKIKYFLISKHEAAATDAGNAIEELIQENTDLSESPDIIMDEKNKQDWLPKDNATEQIQELVNLNLPKNYPQKDPQYHTPEKLPVPSNDW